MPTATAKTALCPACELPVDLVRGKVKEHPAKDRPAKGAGSKALCPGSGVKPLAAPTEPPPDAGTPDTPPVVLEPSLDLMLVADERPTGAWSGAEAATIDPALCDPDPHNPRRDLGDVAELAASLIASGMLEPIIVAPGPTEGRYTIAAGHRRVAAALMANLPEVPALIRADLTPGSNLSLVAQVVENLHRLALSPLEEANAYELLRQLGMKQTDIATAVGVNQGQVSKRLALLKLPAEIAETVGTDGGIDVATAVELTRLPAAARKEAVEQITRGGGNADGAVRTARAKAEREAARDAVIDRLEAAKVAIVDFPASWHWGRDREDRPLKTGVDGDEQPYAGARTIDVTYAAHADEPCHGASVSARDEVVYVCLDPTRHGYPSLQDEAAEAEAERSRADEEREAARAAALAAVAARTAAAKATALAEVKRPQMTAVVASYAVEALLWSAVDTVGLADGEDVIDLVAAWSGLDSAVDQDEPAVTVGLQLLEQHGHLRLAYMAAIATGEAMADEGLTLYRRDLGMPGSTFLADHFARLAEYGGYEMTDADEALIALGSPPVEGPPQVPDEEPPTGALAWYAPTAAAVEAGDEPRWVIDEGEIDALVAAGAADRLVRLEQPVAAEDGSPDAEMTNGENASSSDPDDVNQDPANVDPSAVDAVDAGDVPTAGERCPASRKLYASVAGNASGIPCPGKCGAEVSTTAQGRVRDHDVPVA